MRSFIAKARLSAHLTAAPPLRSVCHTTLPLRVALKPDPPPRRAEDVVDDHLIVGNTAVGIRDNTPYTYHRAEFLGAALPRSHFRSNADRIFSFIDISTFRSAVAFIKGDETFLNLSKEKGYSMATVAFNSFTFTRPVLVGDLIHTTSKVIHTGDSSLGVHIVVRRQSYDSPTPQYVGESYVTMVLVMEDNLNQTAKGYIPAVRLSTPEDVALNENYVMIRKNFRSPSHKNVVPGSLTAERVELPSNKTKERLISMKDAVISSEKRFGVKHINRNGVIFGGSILRFMEQSALHCGCVFAQESRILTLGMMGMTFDSPIIPGDGVCCTARVTCVRNSTMLVNVQIEAETAGNLRVANQANFLLIAMGDDGKPFNIASGLDLSNATQNELLLYEDAAKTMKASEIYRQMRLTRTAKLRAKEASS